MQISAENFQNAIVYYLFSSSKTAIYFITECSCRALIQRLRWWMTVIERDKMTLTGFWVCIFQHFYKSKSHQQLVASNTRSVWDGKGCSDQPAAVLITPQRCDRGHLAVNHLCMIHDPHMTQTQTHNLSAHIRPIMHLETHIDTDTHLNDHSQPPRGIIETFQPWPLWERERASERAERWRESLNLTGCSPGRTPIIAVCLLYQIPQLLSESSRTPTALIFSQGSSSAIARFKNIFGEKNLLAKGFSHPVSGMDNDIPPAVANSARAEDKCHDQLSVMWS